MAVFNQKKKRVKIISIFGEAGSGKSSLANYLENYLENAMVLGIKECLKERKGLSLNKYRRQKLHDASLTSPNDGPIGGHLIDFYSPKTEGYTTLLNRIWMEEYSSNFIKEKINEDTEYIIIDDARNQNELIESKIRGWTSILVYGRRKYSIFNRNYWWRTERQVRKIKREHFRAVNWKRRWQINCCNEFSPRMLMFDYTFNSSKETLAEFAYYLKADLKEGEVCKTH